MVEQEEKKNKRIAAFTTVALNALLLVLLLFVAAWRAPNPPLPEYGIELNFGVDTQGGGEIQPEEPVGSNEATEDAELAASQPEETTPAESETTEPTIVNKQESPVTVKEAKETPKEPVKEIKKEEKKTEPVKTEEKPKEVPQTVYTPKTTTDKNTTDKTGKADSQGDDKGKTGDKGVEKGVLDPNASYSGNLGGGDGGVGISGFKGFEWPKIVTPEVPEEAYGIYEFIVIIDDEGDVINVVTEKRGPSSVAHKKFEDIVRKLTFVPQGANPPSRTEGRIVFKVVSK